jgi:hypothetical protein
MNMLKLAIWTTTIVGLAPVALLAVLNLASNVSLARQMKEEAGFEHDDGGSAYFTQSYMQFGKTLRLEVATSLWPSVCLLVGASACVVGLLFLIPRQTQFMEAGGFKKIQKHVEKVMNSRSTFAYVVISPSDDEYTAITFSKGDDGNALDFYLTKQAQIEPVLAFFSERGIEPVEDYVADEDTECESRNLSFLIDGTAEEVAAICASILTDVYGVGKDRELLFTDGRE